MKKIISFCMLVALLFTTCFTNLISHDVLVSASSNDAAVQAYNDLLEQSQIAWADNENCKFPQSTYQFDYMAIGKEKIPMLFLTTVPRQTDHSNGNGAVYMYVNKKVKCVAFGDMISGVYQKSKVIEVRIDGNSAVVIKNTLKYLKAKQRKLPKKQLVMLIMEIMRILMYFMEK